MSGISGVGARGELTAEYATLVSGNLQPAQASASSGHASYVIVPESDTPHSTLATAQALPNLPFFGVVGTLGSEEPTDLFRMTISPGMAGFRLELATQQPATAAPVQLSLFDAAGNELGRWTAGTDAETSAAALNLTLASQPPGSTLFVGISANAPSGSSGPAAVTDYQLWFTRLTTSDRQPTAASGDTSSSSASPQPSPLTVLGPSSAAATTVGSSGPAPLAAVATAGQAQATANETGGLGTAAAQALAVGSLPTRAAGPLGGFAAGGEVAGTSTRALTLSVGLKPSDRSATSPERDPDAAAAVMVRGDGEPGQEGGSQVLVALRGPGGFPLLGAAARGNRRRIVPSSSATLAAIDALARERLVPPQPATPPVDPVAETLAVAEAAVISDDQARPVSWRESRVTLSFGLSLATFVTLNVVLSDPVAGFDYLASRFDREEHDPKRARRSSSLPPRQD